MSSSTIGSSTSIREAKPERPWRVAAVCPCFNRPQDLEILLEDFAKLDLTNITLWVTIVDNASTKLDVASWRASYPQLEGVFERVPPDSSWGEVWETHCSSWSVGNVALIGDAAFSMAPNLGQGGCTALQAAISMTKSLQAAAAVEEGLKRWEAQERPHVDYVQRWSGRYSRLCSKTPGPFLRGRSRVFGTWGRSKRLNDRFAGVEARLLASA